MGLLGSYEVSGEDSNKAVNIDRCVSPATSCSLVKAFKTQKAELNQLWSFKTSTSAGGDRIATSALERTTGNASG